ncbi:MAG: electron transport complex subunit RsxC [Lachnospiraceae bacterium]|nr:electron transport complex subunit RsxC [Lachnospiraceae bacterium]
MGKSTFLGGIHPYEGKELTMDKPTTVLLPKGDLVFPMSQHIGAPAKPVVAVGDHVLVGQKIGEAGGFISSNIISSISGSVKAIEKRLVVSGKLLESIVIENDHEYKTVEGYGNERDYKKMSKDEIREAVKEAGIVGLGGAGFPTNVKLAPKNEDAIDFIVINGAECEPYLTSDYRLMMEEPEKIVGGLKIMLRLFDHAKGIIAIEDNKPEAIKKFKELTSSEERIEVQALKTKYPQGGERQLVYVTTGRKLNSKKLPADVGCVVDNVTTVAAIYMAVAKSTPLTHRIVTISGDAVTNPQNFNVPIGTDFGEIVEAAGGFKQQPEKIVFGGPMMGMAMYTYHIPVTKTTSSLLGFIKDEAAVEESPCIRCGRCSEHCPLQLVPMQLAQAGAHNDEERFVSMDGLECCGCGCCSFVCPARRGLTQKIMQTRNQILANRKKAK